MGQDGVRVGVAVFCRRNDKFLMIRRGRGYGKDCWSVPGGALEPGETWAQAGIREVREEVGLTVNDLSVLTITNDDARNLGGEHWVTVWLVASTVKGEVNASEEAPFNEWVDFDCLPQPLMQPYWTNYLIAQSHSH